MINLRDFVHAIQNSVDEAMHNVAMQNIQLLFSYFKTKDGQSFDSLNAGNIDSLIDNVLSKKILEPQTVAMEYLREGPSGPVPYVVKVPLISLVPIRPIQPIEINVEFDLECLEHEGSVIISFPRAEKSWFGKEVVQSSKSNAKLTIKIDTSEKPAGLSALIESYDKNLRAQLP